MQEKTANFIQTCRFNLFAGYFFPFKKGLLDSLSHHIVDLVSDDDEQSSIPQNFVRRNGNLFIFDSGMVSSATGGEVIAIGNSCAGSVDCDGREGRTVLIRRGLALETQFADTTQ